MTLCVCYIYCCGQWMDGCPYGVMTTLIAGVPMRCAGAVQMRGWHFEHFELCIHLILPWPGFAPVAIVWRLESRPPDRLVWEHWLLSFFICLICVVHPMVLWGVFVVSRTKSKMKYFPLSHNLCMAHRAEVCQLTCHKSALLQQIYTGLKWDRIANLNWGWRMCSRGINNSCVLCTSFQRHGKTL